LNKVKKVIHGNLVCDLRLRQEARSGISRPKGLVLKELSKEFLEGKKILAVGDAVFRNLVNIGIKPCLCVLDLKIKRQRVKEPKEALKGYIVLKTRNPPGWITSDAWCTIRKAMCTIGQGKKVAVLVDGEEDLLGFPVVINGPLESLLIYGQPDVGAVIVQITEAEKKKAIRMLEESFECV